MKISKKAQAAFDRVVEQFKTGDLSPVVEVAAIVADPNSTVPWDKWSFSNRLTTYIMSNGSTDLRGYEQWRKVGRQVRKGAGTAYILAPVMCKIKEENEDGEIIERMVRVAFRTVPVFAVEDTDGDALPDRGYAPKEPPPLTDLAKSLGIEIRYDAMGGRALGSCTVKGDRITLGTQAPEVFWHELGHALHSRIDGKLAGGQDAGQETVAELTAAVLAAMYSEDCTGNAWKYISGYNKNPLAAIAGAMGTVTSILEYMESVQ